MRLSLVRFQPCSPSLFIFTNRQKYLSRTSSVVAWGSLKFYFWQLLCNRGRAHHSFTFCRSTNTYSHTFIVFQLNFSLILKQIFRKNFLKSLSLNYLPLLVLKKNLETLPFCYHKQITKKMASNLPQNPE